jgi:hypothetical protein
MLLLSKALGDLEEAIRHEESQLRHVGLRKVKVSLPDPLSSPSSPIVQLLNIHPQSKAVQSRVMVYRLDNRIITVSEGVTHRNEHPSTA